MTTISNDFAPRQPQLTADTDSNVLQTGTRATGSAADAQCIPGSPDVQEPFISWEEAMSAPQGSPIDGMPIPGDDLARGAQGPGVKFLQELLIALGFLDKGQADGAFGPITEAAVRMFQEAAGLDEDGIYGPRTQEAFDGIKNGEPILGHALERLMKKLLDDKDFFRAIKTPVLEQPDDLELTPLGPPPTHSAPGDWQPVGDDDVKVV